ncbi:MAG: amidohydrolase family protein, partial [Alphaproteobacteria bacterium]|nr:amidohydrolase family protein [Alphaproteobacteria bacterium]
MQTGDTLLIHNAHLHGAAGDAVLVHGGRIEAVGAGAVLRARAGTHTTMIDAEGRLLTPGLIDCHTHLVYAGNRANEFALRAAGASYAEIAQAGGGIRATMHAVRAADEDMLIAQSLARLDALIGEGVMRVEIKSGYGLDLANERKMLRVARRLGEVRPVSVTTTFLGAHALPPEFASKDAYIDTLCADWLPALTGEGLVDAVDGFCERIAFSPAQIARLFDAAAALGLPVKLHAEQLSNQGGAALAARHKALSADHLEWLDEAG